MTDWNTWARIVDAAQDPRHRDAVQQFLAQTELSAEIPAALDERFLAPGRAAGATVEQCAYVLCNLGFAALVAGKKDSAEFAIGCGRQVLELAPATPDLAMRCHFLFAKGGLMLAVLAGQPHLHWHSAAGRCLEYLRAITESLEALPAEAVESNAMAAYSFTAQLMTRIEQNRAAAHYACELGQLVETAIELAGRLPEALVNRLWNSIIPGTDAGVFFRRVGAEAERVQQGDDDSSEHARKGIVYADELLARPSGGSNVDFGRLMQIRAELLLKSGQDADAMEQADALEQLPNQASRTRAAVVRARNHLEQAEPQSAADALLPLAPGVDELMEEWSATWTEDTGDEHWTGQSAPALAGSSVREILKLNAAVAVALGDVPGFLRAADRSTGFMADALLQGTPGWMDGTTGRSEIAVLDPVDALEEIFPQVDDGTALIQAIDTEEGILAWVARKRGAEISVSIAPNRRNAKNLGEVQTAWNRAWLDMQHRDGVKAGDDSNGVDEFSGLMEAIQFNWWDLLQGLIEDGVSQLVFVGDDLVDIPLHAVRVGTGDERLIDHVPVSWAPSLNSLRASLARERITADGRQALELRTLAEPGSKAASALGVIPGNGPVPLTPLVDTSFWTEAAAAQILHIEAGVDHNALIPLESLLGPGWLDLSIGQAATDLDLPGCEVVSILACESALPSTLRAPGFDLATVFLAAGARNVLASRWLAGQGIAAALISLYFQRWVAGQAPAAAFRDALRVIRKDQPTLEDHEWAGLRLVGAP